MKKPLCLAVTATLSSRGEAEFTPRMQTHVERCFTCRSELSEFRAFHEELALLKATEYRAPREVYPRVMSDIGPWVVPDSEIPRTSKTKVAAAAVVATAATAAAGTAVIFRMYRHRAA